MSTCIGTTQSGKACTKTVLHGKYCHLHVLQEKIGVKTRAELLSEIMKNNNPSLENKINFEDVPPLEKELSLKSKNKISSSDNIIKSNIQIHEEHHKVPISMKREVYKYKLYSLFNPIICKLIDNHVLIFYKNSEENKPAFIDTNTYIKEKLSTKHNTKAIIWIKNFDKFLSFIDHMYSHNYNVIVRISDMSYEKVILLLNSCFDQLIDKFCKQELLTNSNKEYTFH